MLPLLQLIWKEKCCYYTEQSPEEIKTSIKRLIERNRGASYVVNLAGEFTSANEFTLTPKWQLAVIRNYERDLTYLKGKIYVDELHRTRVDFTVRPNSIFLIFMILFPFIGSIMLLATSKISNAPPIGIFYAFIVPVVLISLGFFAKRAIKNRFIEAFKLVKVE